MHAPIEHTQLWAHQSNQSFKQHGEILTIVANLFFSRKVFHLSVNCTVSKIPLSHLLAKGELI